jgi:hypothetical protein
MMILMLLLLFSAPSNRSKTMLILFRVKKITGSVGAKMSHSQELKVDQFSRVANLNDLEELRKLLHSFCFVSDWAFFICLKP